MTLTARTAVSDAFPRTMQQQLAQFQHLTLLIDQKRIAVGV